MSEETGRPPKAQGQWACLLGVLVAPGRTFASLGERAPLLAPYAVLTAASVLAAVLTLGKTAAFSEEVLRASGSVPPEAVQAAIRVGAVAGLAGAAVGPLLTGLAAAAVLALAALLAGGRGQLRPLLSMVGYASLPAGVLGALVRAALVRAAPVEEMVLVSTSAAAFLGREQAGTWVYRLAYLLDPFALWTAALAVIGYAAVAGLRPARAAAVVLPLWALVQLAAVLGQEQGLARLPM